MDAHASTQTTVTFTPQERLRLLALRARYQQSRDQLDERELARLRFLRWLYETGRLVA